MYRYSMSPPASLSVALAIEERQIRCHREWALQLRPFDLGLSKLLMSQAEEMESYRRDLLYHASLLLDGRDRLTRIHARHERVKLDHFFILSREQARLLFVKASQFMDEALNFYCSCLIGTSDRPLSRLTRLYQLMAGLKKSQGQRLQQTLARLRAPSFVDGFDRSFFGA